MISRKRLMAVLLCGFFYSPVSSPVISPLLAQTAAPAVPGAAAAPSAADEAKAKAFKDLCDRVQRDVGGVSEQDVLQLLSTSRELGRPYSANIAVKGYFSRHLQPSAVLLLPAADNAFAAGDYRTAVARYKAYLRDAAPSAESSAAAAKLYTILIDYIVDGDDAFDTNGRFGDKFRQSVDARRFDAWYLDLAVRRNYPTAVANRLASIMGDGLPAEQEKLYYWDSLDWLLAQISQAAPRMFDALPAMKKITPLIRDNQIRQLRAAFYTANLEYKATAAGKDEPAMDKSFVPVAAAAKAYFDAFPNIDTLNDIMVVWSGGLNGLALDQWNHQAGAKHDFLMAVFPRLSDTDKTAVIGLKIQTYPMAVLMATPAQWSTLGFQYPAIFKAASGTAVIPFAIAPTDPSLFAKQAAFLNGVPSRQAAIINSLAASTTDLSAQGKELLTGQSWYLNFNEPWQLFSNAIWPTFSAFPRDAKTPLPNDTWSRAIVQFGSDAAKTPAVLFDRDLAKAYLLMAWSYGGANPNDKSKMAGYLHSLDWVPYTAVERKEVVGPAYDEYKRWADAQRKAADGPNKAALGAQITTLEAEFTAALDPKVTDLTKAPDALTHKLAETVIAFNNHKVDDFIRAGRETNALVRDYDTKRTPFGLAILGYLAANHLETFDTFDLQTEILADQLALAGGNAADPKVAYVMGKMITGHPGWGNGFNLPAADMAKARKLNGIFTASLLAQIPKGPISPATFDCFRNTRRWGNSSDFKMGEEVIAAMIENKTLLKQNDIRTGWISGTSCLAWLVTNESATLSAKYPVQTYFDSMFIEEANQTQYVDWSYLYYGRDVKKLVINAAAQILGNQTILPLGYHGEKMPWTKDLIGNWDARLTTAEAPIRDPAFAKIEATFGKTRFDDWAMGKGFFFTNPPDIRIPANRKVFFDNLTAYVDRAGSMPTRLMPPTLNALASLDPKTLTDAELATLIGMLTKISPQNWQAGWYFETLATDVNLGLMARNRETELLPLMPIFWKIERDGRDTNYERQLIQFAHDLGEKGFHDLSVDYVEAGIQVMGTGLPEDIHSALASVRSKSMPFVGPDIAVPRSDPHYAIYVAQADYLSGKIDSAWTGYAANSDMVLSTFKDLDPAFLIWLVERNTELRAYDKAESLARPLMQMVESTPTGFDPEIRAGVHLAYADIAFARQEFPRARAQYEQVAAAPEYEGTEAKRHAQLRVAEVDRVTKQYDSALTLLDKLTRSPDRALQAEAYYEEARIHYDQEDWQGAMERVQQVFSVNPNHVQGRLLEGDINIKLKKYDIVTPGLPIGLGTDQTQIVPGEPLKISLEDSTLAVAGNSTNIEVHVWTDAGDDEYFNLYPVGDSKTKFSGQIVTALGSPITNDHILQILGGKTVFYELSHRGKPKDASTEKPHSMTIASDADFHASSGKILSKQELEEQALENMIREHLQMNSSYQQPLPTRRNGDEVKPGNPIHVRLVDPAMAMTDKKDTVNIRATTTSGNAIEAFPLTETEPYSGIFEGAIPTTSGEAAATASDSDEGVSPNFAISAGKYPAWVGRPDNLRPKSFSVDLNDNVILGKMTIAAGIPGRKLKEFALQTSLNGKNFTTVATWPKPTDAWDGTPSVDAVRYLGMGQAPSTLSDFDRYLEETCITKGARRSTIKTKSGTLSADWPRIPNWQAGMDGLGGNMGLAWDGVYYVAHFYSAFYLPHTQFKTFQIDPKGKLANITYLLAIDGKVDATPLKVARSLPAGVHRVDVYMYTTRDAAPTFELQSDIPDAPFMAACPPEMFDPVKQPLIKQAVYSAPATIKPDATASQFDVAFAPDAHARVLRILITDFETDAPAISSIKLTNAKGDQVLPTATDFMERRKSRVLEIVPGDRITIAYDNPTPLTPDKKTYESFLNATYFDAQLSACFVEYAISGGERTAQYIPMRRFRAGDPVNVFINDPDEDTTDKQDSVTFTVNTPGGKPITVTALETDNHSGVFLGKFFPVSGTPTRDTEVQCKPDEDLIISYLDKENTNPGIPWMRTYRIEQASSTTPEIRVFNVKSIPLTEEQRKVANVVVATNSRNLNETYDVTRSLVLTRPDHATADQPNVMMIGGPLVVEITDPGQALSPKSTVEVFAQTSSGRHAASMGAGAGAGATSATTQPTAASPATQPDDKFDPNVPGTIKVLAQPSDVGSIAPPLGYRDVLVTHSAAATALDDGRFTVQIPVALGKLPEKTLIDEPDPANDREGKTALLVNGTDEIFIGFKYTSPDGQVHWATQHVSLRSDPTFDVMDRHFQQAINEVHVGEKIYFRIVEPARDVTDEKDTLKLDLTTTSGQKRVVPMVETFGHSGIFKGMVELAFVDDPLKSEDPNVLPVTYGDVIDLHYNSTGLDGQTVTLERKVNVFKGADGKVMPFTKRFKDPAIAVQTQFTIAESYFELAKKHRELKEEDLSRREIEQGRKLLEEAIRDYPDTQFKSQADYLLANLAAEYGKDATDPVVKKRYQVEAITLFGNIVSSDPEGSYAPKAQYKKALVLEQMGEIDQACEEYVKLSYRYPDNELVAETIARLGQYFLTKGKEFEEKASAQTDPVEREKVRIQARDMFRTSAQVFGRLAVRFPQHSLAGRTMVLSAQAYMRADDTDKAIEVFKTVIDDAKADKDLIAQSMYWCGDCYMKKPNSLVDAYHMFKRVTWDYPESQWAKFARGRLTDEKLVTVDEQEANKK